jgi:hypothetical protein
MMRYDRDPSVLDIRIVHTVTHPGQRCQRAICQRGFAEEDLMVATSWGNMHIACTLRLVIWREQNRLPVTWCGVPGSLRSNIVARKIDWNMLNWHDTTRDGAIEQAKRGHVIRRNPDVSRTRGVNTYQWTEQK